MKGNRIPLFLAVIVVLTIIWSGIAPAERGVWWMEICWVVGVFAVLAATYRRFRFSTAAYALVTIWLVMHAIGAHYTFEYVPFGWVTDLFGFERNHYDRVAHFAVGLNSFMIAELCYRRRLASGRLFASFIGVIAIMAMACLWEIIEWVVAVADGGADGLAFLGSQGDVWDAQEDMLADTLGAVSAAVLFAMRRRRS